MSGIVVVVSGGKSDASGAKFIFFCEREGPPPPRRVQTFETGPIAQPGSDLDRDGYQLGRACQEVHTKAIESEVRRASDNRKRHGRIST